MKTVISKKLAAIMPVNEEIKINNTIYRTGISLTKLKESDKDYTIDLNAGQFNYFCYNKNNKITCWELSKGPQPLNDNSQWKKEGRQEIKPGKFLLLFTSFFKVWTNDNINYIDDNLIKDKVIRRCCELFAEKIKGSNESLIFDISDNISEIYNLPAIFL